MLRRLADNLGGVQHSRRIAYQSRRIYFLGRYLFAAHHRLEYFAFAHVYGNEIFYLELSDGNGADLNNLIHPYTNGSMLEIIKARLLSILYIFLGVICFVIPGIYLALKYAMIEYVIADDKEMKYDAAMKRSGGIMKNQKGRLIVLVLSFIPWFLLVGITLGIAFVYVGPYFEATMVNFYKDIKLKKEREAADFQ